jgi:hypothetical protein
MSESFENKSNNVIKGPWGEKKPATETQVTKPDKVLEPSVETTPPSSTAESLLKQLYLSKGERNFTDLLNDPNILNAMKRGVFGVEETFGNIYQTALNNRPREDKISLEIMRYKDWSVEDLLTFANNPENHPHFKLKPALVIAIFTLITQKT